MLKKLLLCILAIVLLSTSAFAAQQAKSPMMLGFLPSVPSTGASTTALNVLPAAGGWGVNFSQSGLAYSVVPVAACQVSKIKVYASAVGGTLAATDLVANMYNDGATGQPGTTIESRTSVTATPTGAAWVEFTGFTATSSLTAGTQYWIVLRNANLTSNVNFPTYRYGQALTGPSLVASNGHTTWGMNKTATTDGGQTWATATIGTWGWRIECSDGSFIGLPFSNATTSTSGDYIYGTREFGCRLTTPANAKGNVIGAMFPIGKLGTPAKPLYYRLYSGSGTGTLLASTPDVPVANITTSKNWIVGYFTTAQAVTGGTVLRVVAGHDGAGGDTSNAYQLTLYDIENTSGSKALIGYNGAGMQKTLTTVGGDGATFTDTDTQTPACGLILDTTGEFVAPVTTGGGIIGG